MQVMTVTMQLEMSTMTKAVLLLMQMDAMASHKYFIYT